MRSLLERGAQDLRYALRSLRGTPRPTFAAIACVALGIASASFIFTLADAILLQRLPFDDADRLQRVWTVDEGTGRTGDLSWPDVVDLRDRVRSFDRWEAAARMRIALSAGEGTERVRGEAVTPGYFDLVGARPALGRLFTPAEYAEGADGVIVIGDALWHRVLGGDPRAVGRSVTIRGTLGGGDAHDRTYQVVGVMPADFAGTVDDDVSEFWLPIEHYSPRSVLERRTARMVWVMARLRPGVRADEAAREVESGGRALTATYPEAYAGLQMSTEPVGEYWRRRFRTGVAALGGAAVLLLLIACTNIANLLVARLLGREPELALRAALGAGRVRVVRQVLGEGLIIALAGGTVGVAAAWWGGAALARSGVLTVPAYVSLTPNPRMLIFALMATVGTALLFGALPAILATRVDPARHLRDGGRSVGGRKRQAIADGLVVVEVAFTFALIAGSALLLRSYANLRGDDPGFRVDDLARLAISLDRAEYPDGQAQLGFVREARMALTERPEVRGVTFLAGVLPPWFDAEEALASDGSQNPALSRVEWHAADQEFARVMDIDVLHGRFIEEGDRADGSRVIVVSESVARAITGGEPASALRRSIQPVVDAGTGELGPALEVVGVVEDVRYHGPLGERPVQLDVYVPLEQYPASVISVAVHTVGDAATAIPSLRRALGDLAPTSPLHWISTMENELDAQFARTRFYSWVTGGYGAAALLLALLGVYGLLTHVVARRVEELGIRMALGADAGRVVRLVLGRGLTTVVAGLVLGIGLALAGGAALGSLVYGVGTADPTTLGAAAAAFLVLGLIACWLPARRAGRLDPTRLLRGEGR